MEKINHVVKIVEDFLFVNMEKENLYVLIVAVNQFGNIKKSNFFVKYVMVNIYVKVNGVKQLVIKNMKVIVYHVL